MVSSIWCDKFHPQFLSKGFRRIIMRKKWLELILISIVASLVIMACDKPQPDSVGYDHVITVVCEPENWDACEPILAETLGKIFKTPRTEPLYTLQRIDASDLSINLKNKNLMILTRLEVYSEVTQQVRSMLPDSIIHGIRENPRGYYYQEDAYAKGQALVVVAAKSIADLRSRLKVNQDHILDFYEQKMYERNTAFIYRSGEQFELAEKYFNQYGYYIRMMHDFVEIENNASKNLVWLGRDFPYRWLSVSWAAPVDSLELGVQTDLLLRSTLTSKIGSIILNEDYLQQESMWFKQFSAIKYYGLWESKEEIKGGPFIAYSFYEPTKDRIYLLAGIIHAPDKSKIPYIRQMETIIRTFETELFEPK